MRNFTRKSSYALVAIFVMALPVFVTGPSVVKADSQCQKFDATGYTVCGRFLDYWTMNGGLNQQGYPISAEMSEKSATDGKVYTVQYFERAVFELHPENTPPQDVQLSLLGVQALKAKNAPQAACTYCPANFNPYKDDQAPTGADPLNKDGVGDIVVTGPAMLDGELTSDDHGGPSAPNGDGTHNFVVLVIPAGTSMTIQAYETSHLRVWEFDGMPDLAKAMCHVWAEAYRFVQGHLNNPNVKVQFMGSPMN